MAGAEKGPNQHEKKQASILITMAGIVGFTTVVCISLFTKQPVPLYVLCIFVAIIVPPDLVKRVLRALLGGKEDE